MTDYPINSPLPTVYQDQPVRGWKQAQLAYNAQSNTLQLCSINRDNVFYVPDAKYDCLRLRDMEVLYGIQPRHDTIEGCTCGFYVWTPKYHPQYYSVLRTTGGAPIIRLEVELSGEVIECSRGYRGQYQRILSAGFRRRCYICAQLAQYIALPGRIDDRLTDKANRGKSFTCGRGDVNWCEHQGQGKDLLTLSEVSNILGIECQWLE